MVLLCLLLLLGAPVVLLGEGAGGLGGFGGFVEDLCEAALGYMSLFLPY